MTGEQSRQLKVGDRVCWNLSATDLGTVVGADWSGVTIKWDDGHTTSVRHNDMAMVQRVLANLGAGPGVGLLRRGCLGLQLYPLMRVGDAAIEPPSLAAFRPAQSAGSWGLCQPSDVRRSPLEKCARQASAVS